MRRIVSACGRDSPRQSRHSKNTKRADYSEDLMPNDLAAGATKSLKASIKEIENFLMGIKVSPSTLEYRTKLHEKLEDLAEYWYRRGFNRGHRESNAQITKGKVPKILEYEAKRDFFTNSKRSVPLKSTLK
jgi:hypothetical protein